MKRALWITWYIGTLFLKKTCSWVDFIHVTKGVSSFLSKLDHWITLKLSQVGLLVSESDAGLQSDDIGMSIALRIVDFSKLPSMPTLWARMMQILKSALARSPQHVNMIKSDMSLSGWQLADNTLVDGAWPATSRSSTASEACQSKVSIPIMVQRKMAIFKRKR